MTNGDPWSVKQHHWKPEAKEENQLSHNRQPQQNYRHGTVSNELLFLRAQPIANFTPSFSEICRDAPNDYRLNIIDQSKLTDIGHKIITTNMITRVINLI